MFRIFVFIIFHLYFTAPSFAQSKIVQIHSKIAVIYRDRALKVPLGYIRKGKNIRISAYLDREKKVLRTSIDGKYAYIHIKDIIFRTEHDLGIRKIREHNIDVNGLDKITLNTKKSSLILSYAAGSSGRDWRELSTFIGDKNNGTSKEMSFKMIYMPKKSRFFYGVGLTDFKIDQTSVKASALYGNLSLYMKVLRYKEILIKLEGSFVFSGDLQVDSAYSVTPSRGIALGSHIGLYARFFPESKWGTLMGIKYQNIKTSELEPIKNEAGDDYFLKSISSTSVFFGLSYHL